MRESEWAEARAGKGVGVVSRWYSTVVFNSWIVCVLYSLTVHQRMMWQHSAIKNQHNEKQRLPSAVINPCRYGSVYDILLLLSFYLLWRLQALCGGNAMCRGRRKGEWLWKGESTLDSLPCLLDRLLGYIQWKGNQVTKCFLKSLVTQRQIMLCSLFTRKGGWHSRDQLLDSYYACVKYQKLFIFYFLYQRF